MSCNSSRRRILGGRALPVVAALLVGALLGGAGISIASSTEQITFCVNKKNGIVRQPKAGRCARTESRLVLGTATGPAVTGAVGPKGDAGIAGERGPAGAKGDAGATGEQGPAGPQGPAGARGESGPTGGVGPTGGDGKTVLSGSGVPTVGTGVNGDFYIDTAAQRMYGPKSAGAWGVGTSLVGPTGAAGASGDTWTLVTTGSTTLSSGNSSRVLGAPFSVGPVTGFEFLVTCWLNAGPKHVVEYEAALGEVIVATAYPIGGSGIPATWISRTRGVQDLGAVQASSTRWVISVRNETNETTETYEIIVETSSSQCSVDFSVAG